MRDCDNSEPTYEAWRVDSEIYALQEERDELDARVDSLKKALRLALVMLNERDPADIREVAYGLAIKAMLSDTANKAVFEVIDEALARYQV